MKGKEAGGLANAAYMQGYGGKKWFHFSGPAGTITEKGAFEATARRAAAERLDCDEQELICTGWDPVSVTYKIG